LQSSCQLSAKHFLATVVVACMGQGVAFAQPSVSIPAPSIFDKSTEVIDKANNTETPSWLMPAPDKMKKYKETAQDILNKASQHVVSQHKGEKKKWEMANANGDKILIFVTSGNGFNLDGALDFLTAYAKDKRVAVALAGFPKGCDNIRCSIKKMSKYNKKDRPTPPVTIDPLAFKRFHVSMVPTMLYLKDGVEVGRVTGLYNPEWFVDQLKSSQEQDLGNHGPVVAIAERNLMDVLAERVKKVDWDKKKKAAVANFWKKRDYLDLPRATKEKEFLFEPIVRASKDIKDLKGNVLVKKGTTVNALSKMGFTKSVIVFNAKYPEEINRAVSLASDARKRGKMPVLITTTMPGQSFKAHHKLEKRFQGESVYLLDKKMAQRFHITKTLTVVESEGLAFVVKEIPVRQAGEERK